MPLPPYIAAKRPADDEDKADYQTIWAARPGAVAAPTASLHFDRPLLDALSARGVAFSHVTLHVGAGTFLPVREGDPRSHRLHSEWCELSPEAAAIINQARAEGRRVLAIGTTALRLLETAARGVDDPRGKIPPFRGLTDLYILPGFPFRAADLLLTNFHLPKSTLLMLVSAFAGTQRMRAAYAHAIAQRYRFFSYGDASLLFRQDEDLTA
jgi:S-adenosylmethionine:tRNA ribosyltransferase-isomerase